MKSPSIPNRFNSNSRLLLGFLGVLLSGCVLLACLGAISKTFAARIGSPNAESSTQALSSENDPPSKSGPVRRLDEQGNRPSATLFVPLNLRNLAQSDRLEMELGLHSDRRAEMCSMLLFRPLLQVSSLLASHRMAARWYALSLK